MKWYTYFICFILIIFGSFCGVQMYREIKTGSYVNGSIDVTNKFSQESFSYYNTSITFYHDIYDDTGKYTFEKELLPVEDFNGKSKQYQVVLNDYILIDSEISAGSVYVNKDIDFYDTNGNIVCDSNFELSIKFLSDKTLLTLTTYGEENASFLEQYFNDNGIRLKVIEIL